MAKSSILLLALLAATSSAFTAPQFATRAVGKAAPAKAVATKKVVAKPTKVVVKKAVVKPTKAVVKKAVVVKKVVKPVVKKVVAKPVVKKAVVKPVVKKAVVKPVVKKAVVKKAIVKKAVVKPVVKKVVAKKAVAGKPSALANLLGDIGRKAPTKPNIQIRAPPAERVKKTGNYVFDDGLTVIERTQRATIPAFLSGSAKPSKVNTGVRPDLYTTGDDYFFSPYDTTVATLVLTLLVSFIIKAGSGQ
jgi:hypothetical protein